MIEAAIFDMDGILFDTERLVSECWIEVANKLNIKEIQPILNRCIGLNKKSTQAIFLKQLGEAFDFDEFNQMAHEVFMGRVEKDGLPIKRGVHELLAFLKEKGFKIGLASSTNEKSVRSHLKLAQIEEYFEVIVGGDMVTNGKPDPEIYLRACRDLGVLPQNAIAIEDSHNGIRAASAAGMNVIMVPDLMPCNAEIETILYQKMDSLLEVKAFLSNIE